LFGKELNTSGGVVKHPIYISKEVEAKELNTSGGVVKHPIYIKKFVRKGT
jgi:transcriptional regulator of NAD metabolism